MQNAFAYKSVAKAKWKILTQFFEITFLSWCHRNSNKYIFHIKSHAQVTIIF